MPSPPHRLTRRGLLGAAGGGLALTAGCLGGTDDGSGAGTGSETGTLQDATTDVLFGGQAPAGFDAQAAAPGLSQAGILLDGALTHQGSTTSLSGAAEASSVVPVSSASDSRAAPVAELGDCAL